MADYRLVASTPAAFANSVSVNCGATAAGEGTNSRTFLTTRDATDKRAGADTPGCR